MKSRLGSLMFSEGSSRPWAFANERRHRLQGHLCTAVLFLLPHNRRALHLFPIQRRRETWKYYGYTRSIPTSTDSKHDHSATKLQVITEVSGLDNGIVCYSFFSPDNVLMHSDTRRGCTEPPSKIWFYWWILDSRQYSADKAIYRQVLQCP